MGAASLVVAPNVCALLGGIVDDRASDPAELHAIAPLRSSGFPTPKLGRIGLIGIKLACTKHTIRTLMGSPMSRLSWFKTNPRHSMSIRIAGVPLVATGCEIGTAPERHFSTPLHRALKERDYDTAIQSLRSGAGANTKNDAGELPLVIAANDRSADALDVVSELLRFGTRPDATHEDGDTALHRAAHHGNLAVVELLVRHGADVNASRTRESVVGKRVDTPHSVAYANGHFRVGEFLESMGARAPDGEDIATHEDLGQIDERIDALLGQPPQGNIDEDEWRRVAIKTAFAEVKLELAEWFEEVGRLNPEAMEMLNAVAEEDPPPGMDELEWAHRQFARVKQVIHSGALPIELPRPPPPD